MENRIIKISENIIGVIVPSDAHKPFIDNGMQYLIYDVPNYKNWVKDDVLWDYNKLQKFLSSAKDGEDWKRGGKKLPDGNWKLHGICTLPSLEFDFEPIMGKEELKALIQKAIQDEGLLLVNPYDIKGQTFSNEHQNKWQSAESKTVKGKILIIEKI